MEAPNALPAGHALQEYRIEKVLGVGGFGLTYLALDENLHLRVAVKEYLPADIAARASDRTIAPRSDESAEIFDWGRRRFLDESRTLASFRPEHRARDALLRGERHGVHGDGVRRGGAAPRLGRRAPPARRGAGGGAGGTASRWARGGAQGGLHASRHQAPEHLHPRRLEPRAAGFRRGAPEILR